MCLPPCVCACCVLPLPPPAVEVKPLVSSSAPAPVESSSDSWVPICLPEELPKGKPGCDCRLPHPRASAARLLSPSNEPQPPPPPPDPCSPTLHATDTA